MNFNNCYNTKLTDYGFKNFPIQKQYKSIDLPTINNNKILDKSVEIYQSDKSINYKVNPLKKNIINDLSSLYDKYDDKTRPTSLKHDSKKLNKRNIQSETLDYNQRFFNNFKVLNRKYMEEITKNLYLNSKLKSAEEEEEEEEFGNLNDFYLEKKKFNFQTVFNMDKLVNKLPDLSKKLSSEINTEDVTQINKKKVKVFRFKYESEKYKENKNKIKDFRNPVDDKLKNHFTNNGSKDHKAETKKTKLPKLKLPELNPEKLLPNYISNALSIKDIVGIENAILKPFKF